MSKRTTGADIATLIDEVNTGPPARRRGTPILRCRIDCDGVLHPVFRDPRPNGFDDPVGLGLERVNAAVEELFVGALFLPGSVVRQFSNAVDAAESPENSDDDSSLEAI